MRAEFNKLGVDIETTSVEVNGKTTVYKKLVYLKENKEKK